MKIGLRDKIYITIPDTQHSCKGCAFVSWEGSVCTAPIFIYRACVEFNEILQCSNTCFDIFNL